jgi:uncharacterized protein YbjT (DUF2867 family)
MSQPIIAVVGATGQQGGGLVRAIAADPARRFLARGITREPASTRAQELRALGADVVRADFDDPASMEAAFAGVHGAFCVTNFWEHMDPDRETRQAEALAAAAAAAHVPHAIWSTLEDTRQWVPLDDDRIPTLQGRYKVPHLDAKGAADAEFRRLGVPTTFLRTSFYWDNMVTLGMGPHLTAAGSLAISLPIGDSKLPGIAAEDIGACAFGLFTAGTAYIDRTVAIAGEHLTGGEMAAGLTRALGVTVAYDPITAADYRAAAFPGADDIANMFQFGVEFAKIWNGRRDVEHTRELYPGLQSFDAWLARNGSRIPLPAAAA